MIERPDFEVDALPLAGRDGEAMRGLSPELHPGGGPSRNARRSAPPGTYFLWPGKREFEELVPNLARSFGLLIAEGLIAAELRVGNAHTAWLIGQGDLVRPREMSESSFTRVPGWRVLAPTCVVLLGSAFYQRVRSEPAVMDEALSRAASTGNWLLAKTMIMSSTRLVDRVMLLFSLWAERWGTVTPDGIRLELPLTHQLIAECCGACRPTVTTALRCLDRQGCLSRVSQSEWLLRRNPRSDGGCRCWDQYGRIVEPSGTSLSDR